MKEPKNGRFVFNLPVEKNRQADIEKAFLESINPRKLDEEKLILPWGLFSSMVLDPGLADSALFSICWSNHFGFIYRWNQDMWSDKVQGKNRFLPKKLALSKMMPTTCYMVKIWILYLFFKIEILILL